MPAIGQAVFTEADIASATTCDIGATDQWRLRVTGTVTITSFGTGANKIRFLRFADVLTLTHSASLVLPGAANITTWAGYTVIAVSDASGNWRLFAADFLPLLGGTLSGPLVLPAGTEAAPAIQFGSSNYGFAQIIADSLALIVSDMNAFLFFNTGALRLIGSNAATDARRYVDSAAGPLNDTTKFRGTFAAPTAGQTNDDLGSFRFIIWDGAAQRIGGDFRAVFIGGTPGAGDVQTRYVWRACPAASGTNTELLRAEHATGFSMFGANPVIDQNRHHRLRSYTVATVPVTATAGALIYVSDGTANKRMAVGDGTNWRFPDGNIVS